MHYTILGDEKMFYNKLISIIITDVILIGTSVASFATDYGGSNYSVANSSNMYLAVPPCIGCTKQIRFFKLYAFFVNDNLFFHRVLPDTLLFP